MPPLLSQCFADILFHKRRKRAAYTKSSVAGDHTGWPSGNCRRAAVVALATASRRFKPFGCASVVDQIGPKAGADHTVQPADFTLS
jgi:hypothetical protein